MDTDRDAGEGPDPARDAALWAVLDALRDSHGIDFAGYRRSSLERRVRRRMADAGAADLGAYVELLRTRPAESAALLDTVLVTVTGFLRDAAAWAHLRRAVLPALLAARGGGPVRVWSAGGASGEEAYGVAMLLAELLGLPETRRRVTIEVTDVDADALARAHRAEYAAAAVAAVPAGLRERYLRPAGDRWAVHPDLRAVVTARRHDLVRDAPLAPVDLLVCRNTLMYFATPTQDRVLRGFRDALTPAGVLFVGRAELLLGPAGLFEPLDPERRFFRPVRPADHEE